MAKVKSARDGAILVLKQARRPLATKTIAERTLKVWSSPRGLTPEATISAMLAVSHKNGHGAFVRTAPGWYGLRGRDDKTAKPRAKKSTVKIAA